MITAYEIFHMGSIFKLPEYAAYKAIRCTGDPAAVDIHIDTEPELFSFSLSPMSQTQGCLDLNLTLSLPRSLLFTLWS